MADISYYRARLRYKGQVTIPNEIRDALDAKEGDELAFIVDEDGRVVVERVQMIPPDQAWFWSERWQHLERDVQDDIKNSKTRQFETAEEAVKFLNKVAGGKDAEDPIE